MKLTLFCFGVCFLFWFCFQEEQQKLRGRIQEADEMIKTLDDCICELETGIATLKT